MKDIELRMVAPNGRVTDWLLMGSIGIPEDVEVWADRQQRRTGEMSGTFEIDGQEWQWRLAKGVSRKWTA